MTKPSLGFVGVGRMGAPMVQRLLAAGFTVTICDPVPAAVDAVVKQGAVAANTPRDVADQADIVFASVPTPNIVKQVAVGGDGVVHGKRIKIFVDLSTTGPKTSAEVNQALAAAARPVVMVDCPVSGGVAGAEKGTLSLMIAGPAAARAELEPVMKELGRILLCGDTPGQAQMIKVANNLASVACMAISC